MKIKFARREQKDRGLPPALIRRIKALVVQGIMGVEYGSPVAILKLTGALTDREYEACLWYRELYRSYQKVVGSRGCKSLPIGEAGMGAPPDPDSDRGRLMARHEAWVMREYPRVRLAMLAAGGGAVAQFDSVVVDDREPDGYGGRMAVPKVADLIHKARGSGPKR